MTRQHKTPQQRAQEQLGVAERKAAKLNAKVNTAETELADLRVELADAVRRRDFLAQHPDLQPDAVDEPLPEPDE